MKCQRFTGGHSTPLPAGQLAACLLRACESDPRRRRVTGGWRVTDSQEPVWGLHKEASHCRFWLATVPSSRPRARCKGTVQPGHQEGEVHPRGPTAVAEPAHSFPLTTRPLLPREAPGAFRWLCRRPSSNTSCSPGRTEAATFAGESVVSSADRDPFHGDLNVPVSTLGRAGSRRRGS